MALCYLSRAVNTPVALRLLMAPGPRVAPSSSSPLRPLASCSSQVGLGHTNDVADEAAKKKKATKTKKKKKACQISTVKQQQVTEKETTEKVASRKKMKKIDRSFTGKEQAIQREIVVGAAIRKTENNMDSSATGKELVVEEASEMEKKKIVGEEILLEVASNSKAEKEPKGLSFVGEEQVIGKEIVQVASDEETTESETDGSESDSDVGEDQEKLLTDETDEEFKQVFAEVNELLAYTTRDAIYDRFSLDGELLMVRLSRKKPFVQAMYFYARDVLLEELESRRKRARGDDGGS